MRTGQCYDLPTQPGTDFPPASVLPYHGVRKVAIMAPDRVALFPLGFAQNTQHARSQLDDAAFMERNP